MKSTRKNFRSNAHKNKWNLKELKRDAKKELKTVKKRHKTFGKESQEGIKDC